LSSMRRLPFDAMPGLPAKRDAEVAALMEAVGLLPRCSVDELVRSVLRAALGWERTGELAYPIRLAEDMLVTVRLRRCLFPGGASEIDASLPAAREVKD
jgi:hypothetical protein